MCSSDLGAITTAQYAGAALGNFAVGAMGDGLGARETLAATLLGDVVLFTLTALATKPGALLAIRLVAGMSSPLVAALMYILQRASTKSQTLKGVNAYSLSVNGGYALGGVVVGVFLFEPPADVSLARLLETKVAPPAAEEAAALGTLRPRGLRLGLSPARGPRLRLRAGATCGGGNEVHGSETLGAWGGGACGSGA